MRMHKIAFISTTLLLCLSLNTVAQTNEDVFKGRLVNQELEVRLVINLYDNNIKVPQQEDIFGDVPGYFAYQHDGRKWIVVEAEVHGEKALLTIVNDYGSEDLTATLTHNNDGTFTLRQGSGSIIKIVKDRKWVKMPKSIVFTKN